MDTPDNSRGQRRRHWDDTQNYTQQSSTPCTTPPTDAEVAAEARYRWHNERTNAMYTPTFIPMNKESKRSYDLFVHNPASERPRPERVNHALLERITDELTSNIHNSLKISGGLSSDDVDAGGTAPANEELRYGAASEHEAHMAVQTMLRNQKDQKDQYQRIA
jgi:hypothetical protein